MDALLEKKPDFIRSRAGEYNQYTPLINICRSPGLTAYQQAALVHILLKQGAGHQINEVDNDGNSVLHWCKNMPLLDALLTHQNPKAQVVKNKGGKLPSEMNRYGDNRALITQLKEIEKQAGYHKSTILRTKSK